MLERALTGPLTSTLPVHIPFIQIQEPDRFSQQENLVVITQNGCIKKTRELAVTSAGTSDGPAPVWRARGCVTCVDFHNNPRRSVPPSPTSYFGKFQASNGRITRTVNHPHAPHLHSSTDVLLVLSHIHSSIWPSTHLFFLFFFFGTLRSKLLTLVPFSPTISACVS